MALPEACVAYVVMPPKYHNMSFHWATESQVVPRI